MTKHKRNILILAILEAAIILLTAYCQKSNASDYHLKENSIILVSSDQLKQDAFNILTTKCNVCHRKRNPFMVFSLKNMEKRAPKIYKQVFIEKRMPKGDEIHLTDTEYTTLKKWLNTQNIF